jgi:hypothetical protein
MEICVEVYKDEEYVVPIIKNMMESVKDKIPYVPIVSEVEYTTTNWAEKEKWSDN